MTSSHPKTSHKRRTNKTNKPQKKSSPYQGLWLPFMVLGGVAIITFVFILNLLNTTDSTKTSQVNTQVNKSSLVSSPILNKNGLFVLNTAEGLFDMTTLKESIVLVYFGYTACPDLCPTGLGHIATFLKQLTSRELEKINVVFITLDPTRDTSEVVKSYSQAFHPKIIGLSPLSTDLERVTQQYGVVFKANTPKDETAYYTIDHTASIFVVGKDSFVKNILEYDTTSEDLLRTVRPLL